MTDASKKAPLKAVQLNDPFFRPRQTVVRDVVVPYQWKALHDEIPGVEPSHAVENFRIAAGLSEGQFKGMVFQDSDVAKWIEAAAYVLALEPDEELEQKVDGLVELIAQAQGDDGYLNTYFTVAEPDKRWTNLRDQHELYCAGHMIEAAVAYFEATGKRSLLDVVCRFADHIDSKFGREPGKMRGYPGHPEIELALVRLYRATGERRYLDLSAYFVDERGRKPHWYALERGDTEAAEDESLWISRGYDYSQAHAPVREQQTAEGHSVRAVYLFSAMADLALETGDESLRRACERLWENVTERRMYITGGIGSQGHFERFTADWDLPNDVAYAETCAAIGLVFWAQRMLRLDTDRRYADVMERALYNGVMSGISLDGSRFFYVNPLEVGPPAAYRHDHHHVKPVRQGWFTCACCPPNIARLIASVGGYMYGLSPDEGTVHVHLYAESEAEIEIQGAPVRFSQKTRYPWEGTVTIEADCDGPVEFALALRIPGWSRGAELTVNGEPVEIAGVEQKGYAVVRRAWRAGDQVRLELPMPVERVRAHPKVRENAGKVVLQRGPIVYCLEEVDNGPDLPAVELPVGSELRAEWRPDLLGGVTVIKGSALRWDEEAWKGRLYAAGAAPAKRPVEITAVPYAVWGNRAPGEMLVWIREADAAQ